MKTELEEIQKKLVEGEERNVSGIERLGYILGSCSSEDSSVALAVAFWGMRRPFQRQKSRARRLQAIGAISNKRKKSCFTYRDGKPGPSSRVATSFLALNFPMRASISIARARFKPCYRANLVDLAFFFDSFYPLTPFHLNPCMQVL